MNPEQAAGVLEEVLRRAMDEGLELRDKDQLNEHDEGALMAYFTLLDWGKSQAELSGIEFADRELQDFDPYSLLNQRQAA
ncbi:hypothetical protein [Imhoffiella purpurea]|uniref:Uncharacterized protein n=1 Tax=Imhoffiella purpurea TaxID=1249627 RepID=W9V6S3_9GAMM|nr:hypothetical protein [Imhoffiella purpurea]EXJ15099.1 hypothetical protein D779_1653 [Imhoffiella purpurea]